MRRAKARGVSSLSVFFDRGFLRSVDSGRFTLDEWLVDLNTGRGCASAVGGRS